MRKPDSVIEATSLLERCQSLPDGLVVDVQAALEFGLVDLKLRVPLLGLARKLVSDCRFHDWIRCSTTELSSRWSELSCEERGQFGEVIGAALRAGLLDSQLDSGALDEVLDSLLELEIQTIREALFRIDPERLSAELVERLRCDERVTQVM
jgi:hypothetical protein